jgi:hypothetical protein
MIVEAALGVAGVLNADIADWFPLFITTVGSIVGAQFFFFELGHWWGQKGHRIMEYIREKSEETEEEPEEDEEEPEAEVKSAPNVHIMPHPAPITIRKGKVVTEVDTSEPPKSSIRPK